MEMDIQKNRYADFTALYDYCYKVAGIVGLMMLQILGYNDIRAKTHAIELGIAMQLTNILRDIYEDFLRNRIYLPMDECKKYGISEAAIAEKVINEKFIELMKFQIEKARQFYRNAQNGIEYISDNRSKLVVSNMLFAYAGILKNIEKNHYDIYSHRISVSKHEKLLIAMRLICTLGYSSSLFMQKNR
jgi:15-cis-phytoene synthase